MRHMGTEAICGQGIRGRGLAEWSLCLLGLGALLFLSPSPAVARQTDQSPNSSQSSQPSGQADQPAKPPKPNKNKNQDDQPVVINHWLRIEVIGADEKKPIEDASVYVKFTEVHKIGKDKQIEFDLKTNQEGVARAPDVPLGKVLIQVVLKGWKPFGEYYDIEQPDQTIHIELVRPPRWY
jgi:hypothetical protein